MNLFDGERIGRIITLCGVALLAAAGTASAVGFYAAEMNGNIEEVGPTATSPFATVTANDSLSGMTFDSAGNIIVADSTAGAVYSYNAAGTRTTIATGLMSPGDVAVDSVGNIYVANSAAGTILKYGSTGGTATTYASGLLMPEAITFDPSGNLYVAERGSSTANSGQITKIAAGGASSTVLATGLNSPTTLTLDSTSTNVFINGGSGILGFTAANGTTVSTYSSLTFSSVGDLTFDTAGNLYVLQSTSSATAITEVASDLSETNFAAPSTYVLGFLYSPSLIVVPEPSAWSAVLAGAAGLLVAGWVRRRRAL